MAAVSDGIEAPYKPGETDTRIMSSSELATNNRRIPGLDGLRAVSILLVLIGHASMTIRNLNPHASTLLDYLGNGRLGVLTFFVISGYLITILLKKEWDRSRTIDLRAFYRRRVLRIFPAFYCYLLVIALLSTVGMIHTHLAYICSAATFSWNYSHYYLRSIDQYSWFVGHFWTLSLEEQFYLLWPVTLLLLRPRRAGYIALSLALLMPPLRVALYFLYPSERPFLGNMLHTAVDPIMIGCLLALAQEKPRFERAIRPLLRWYVPAAAAIFALIISAYLEMRYRGVYQLTVGVTLESAAIALILIWLTRRPESTAGKLFNTPVMVRIGILSYSLYLWQQLFLTTFNTTWTGAFPLNLLVCFVVAEMSYRLIEKPFLALKSRRRAYKPRQMRPELPPDQIPAEAVM